MRTTSMRIIDGATFSTPIKYCSYRTRRISSFRPNSSTDASISSFVIVFLSDNLAIIASHLTTRPETICEEPVGARTSAPIVYENAPQNYIDDLRSAGNDYSKPMILMSQPMPIQAPRAEPKVVNRHTTSTCVKEFL